MKKLFLSLALALSALTLHATQYTFGDFDVTLTDQAAQPWTDFLDVQLGTFASGFVPTAANLTDWQANWVNASSGYYDGSGPEWNASLALADNSVFAVGAPLFLWVFDNQDGIGSNWGLFADPSWLIAGNDGLDPTTYFLDFTSDSTAIYGSLDLGNLSASTSLVSQSSSSVPDSGVGTGLALGATTLLLIGLRKRLDFVAV